MAVLMPPPGSFPPGSFTKNFGWQEKGFLGLHQAIQKGFGGKLQAVERETWRSASGLNSTRFLLAANFYLFNVRQGASNLVAVDEFVRQAIMDPHSLAFDRLALFVFNLSLGGKRTGASKGVEFPAAWANAFVREELWEDGRWRRAALAETTIDTFLKSHITGVPEGRTKCRTNYRHLFELTKLIPSSYREINTDAESWVAGALFTAWDRRALSSGGTAAATSASALVSASEEAEDYKLLGISLDEFRTMARPIAEQYASADGVDRFGAAVLPLTATLFPKSTTTPKAPAPAPSVEDLGWLTAAGSDAAVEREVSKRLAQKRNQVIASKLKALYGHKCMACGTALVIGLDPERCHSEAAHIKPLGSPHNGPDKTGNMLVLCPSHHIQFDRGILSLRVTSKGVRFVSRLSSDPIHGHAIDLHPNHELDADCVKWHRDMFANVGKS